MTGIFWVARQPGHYSDRPTHYALHISCDPKLGSISSVLVASYLGPPDVQCEPFADSQLEPVGSYPGDVSAYGVYDMVGNSSEWVAAWYAPDYYLTAPTSNPQGPPTGNQRVIMGTHHTGRMQPIYSLIFAERPEYELDWIGFRCAD